MHCSLQVCQKPSWNTWPALQLLPFSDGQGRQAVCPSKSVRELWLAGDRSSSYWKPTGTFLLIIVAIYNDLYIFILEYVGDQWYSKRWMTSKSCSHCLQYVHLTHEYESKELMKKKTALYPPPHPTPPHPRAPLYPCLTLVCKQSVGEGRAWVVAGT